MMFLRPVPTTLPVQTHPDSKYVIGYFNPTSPVQVFVPVLPKIAQRGKFMAQVAEVLPKKDLGLYAHLRYRCYVEICIPNTRASKGVADIDNLLKRVLDSIKGRLLHDDVQIIELRSAFKLSVVPGFFVRLEPLHPNVVTYSGLDELRRIEHLQTAV